MSTMLKPETVTVWRDATGKVYDTKEAAAEANLMWVLRNILDDTDINDDQLAAAIDAMDSKARDDLASAAADWASVAPMEAAALPERRVPRAG